MRFVKQRKVKVGSILVSVFLTVTTIRVATAANSIMFADDFEGCNYAKYQDIASNKIDLTVAHSGKCSSKIGGAGVTFGKLLAPLSSSSSDVWLTAQVYFPKEFSLPGGGEGFHIFRLLDRPYTAGLMQLDFVVPYGGATIQLYHGPGDTGGDEAAKNTNFNPAADGRRGRWQCWEIHTRLNTPGQSDGLLEFYADGVLVDSVSGKFRGNSTNPYTYVDVQSNIGSTRPELWPTQNWWYVDDVAVSTGRVGCAPNVTDKTPPNPPGGLRINVQ